jgi:hypothetical protein
MTWRSPFRRAAVAAAALLALAAAGPRPARAADVTEVLEGMRAALEPGQDMRARLAIDAVNELDERVRWTGRWYRRHGEQPTHLVVLETPSELRGIWVAAERRPGRIDRIRVYLPFIRRMREIGTDMQGESFLGTDYNYEDLGLEQLDYQRHALKEPTSAGGRPCDVLESVPENSWWYGRIVRYVDRDNHLPIETRYFDRANRLYKIRTFDRIASIDGHPTARRITMHNRQADTRTVLHFSDVEYDVGLDASLFDSPHPDR